MTADLKALCEETLRLDAAATPGEWRLLPGSGLVVQDGSDDAIAECEVQADGMVPDEDTPNLSRERWAVAKQHGALIAHYRTAAPALARALLSAMAERDAAIQRGVSLAALCVASACGDSIAWASIEERAEALLAASAKEPSE